jgi:two-component system, LytTR family, response regulator
MSNKKLKVFLVDDEPLALKRLSRLLDETGKVEIIGNTTEPLIALQIIPNITLDAIFLDIQMPELTGFELLQKLENYPPVIFTTAFDEFALKAFEVYSVDYLLKPIEAERLEKALEKLEKLIAEKSDESTANLQKLLENLAPKPMLERLPSRIGGKVQIIDVKEITHFYAEDKMTFAGNLEGKNFPLDSSLNELEKRLDGSKFLRVHRNSIVNVNFIEEVHGWFSGQVMIRLKNARKSEIIVARDRVKILKDFLGL